ncbi:MAG: hypothetical protein NW204_13535 [Xanthomonadaceae bacterium]|nr:hypothetical protein [Xanthomonadaceae bacterium]
MNIGPHDYLRLAIDPIARDLDSQGAPHLIVGFLPGPGALHIASNAAPLDMPRALRELAGAMLRHADEVERKPKLIMVGN